MRATLAMMMAAAMIGCDARTPAAPPGKGGADAGSGAGEVKATAWAEPLSVGPITYFNAMCASCHGSYGSQIADHNIARATGSVKEYRSMVEYMVTERASSSLKPRDLDAQTAYCMSLASQSEDVPTDGVPLYVAVKSPVQEGGLEGDVTPGSAVTLVAAKGQVRVEAKVEGHQWSLTPQQVAGVKSSAGDEWVNAAIEARGTVGGRSVTQTLRLSEGAFKGPVLRKK